jgi:hypothetical protein
MSLKNYPMKFFYSLLIVSCFLSPVAHGGTSAFEGMITIDNGQMFFREVKTWNLYRLKASDSSVRKDLLKLEAGDVLQGDGSIDSTTQILTIHSVHFVGLQKMLGVWSSDEKTLFEFIDFNHLTVYHEDQQLPQGRYLPVKSYQYTVAPHGQEKWSILINDNSTINTGKLDVDDKTLTIQLMNSSNGKVSKTLILKRVN